MLQTFSTPKMLQTRVLTWLRTPDLASFLDGSLMNQIPAALTNCQSFLQEDTAILEKGQVLKTTALDSGGPILLPGGQGGHWDGLQTVLQHITHTGEVTALHLHGALYLYPFSVTCAQKGSLY